MDELICLEPQFYPTLSDLLAAQDVPALFALGMNVADVPQDPELPKGAATLSKRSNIEFSGR